MKWGKARKIPVEVEYREPIPNGTAVPNYREGWKRVEWIKTLEGRIYALPGRDLVIRGIKGELYPIKKEIFEATYEVTESCEKGDQHESR